MVHMNNHFKEQAMPWVRTSDTNTDLSRAFLDALRDPNIDKLSLISTGSNGEQYLVAETVDKKGPEISKLTKPKKPGFFEILKNMLLYPVSGSKSTENPQPHDIINVTDSAKDNTRFITYPDIRYGDRERVLAVYDGPRMTKIMEKSLANQHDPLATLHPKKELPFYMPKLAEGKEGSWQLHLRGRQKDEKTLEIG